MNKQQAIAMVKELKANGEKYATRKELEDGTWQVCNGHGSYFLEPGGPAYYLNGAGINETVTPVIETVHAEQGVQHVTYNFTPRNTQQAELETTIYTQAANWQKIARTRKGLKSLVDQLWSFGTNRALGYNYDSPADDIVAALTFETYHKQWLEAMKTARAASKPVSKKVTQPLTQEATQPASKPATTQPTAKVAPSPLAPTNVQGIATWDGGKQYDFGYLPENFRIRQDGAVYRVDYYTNGQWLRYINKANREGFATTLQLTAQWARRWAYKELGLPQPQANKAEAAQPVTA